MVRTTQRSLEDGVGSSREVTWVASSYLSTKGRPDTSLVTDEWADKHIRIEEPGVHYLDAAFVMDSDDTSSFLVLLPNGLNI
ncbi:hypothetical protein PM082_021944 [Marasmius tenuissimus]|nr:hypothetical protein PM082_021944 [Marasmius tenuissimus]